MPQQKDEKFFDRDYDSATASGPGTGDLLVLDYDGEFQLTELTIDLENDGSVQVEIRDDDGSNASTVLNVSETFYQDGDFEDPVAEAGTGQEIAIVAAESLTGEVNVNVRTHLRRI
jgi:hypothetical protein